jgi:hypothetical protein
MAGECVHGKIRIYNEGEEGFFEHDLMAALADDEDGIVAASIRTWLYRYEEKTIEFTTAPLYKPGEYTLVMDDSAVSVTVKQTPAAIGPDKIATIMDVSGKTEFKFDVFNVGGTEGAGTFDLLVNDKVVSSESLTLAPGERVNVSMSAECGDGKVVTLPSGMKWDYKLAANTYSKVRAWDNVIEITAGGKLYSASGLLEYDRLYEYAAVYKTVKGDFSAKFRLVSQEASGQYAAAGIIICSDMTKANECKRIVLHHNAPKYGSMSIFRADWNGDGITEHAALGDTRIGYWLRVDKIGSNYYGYISADGVKWDFLEVFDVQGDEDVHDVGIYGFANSVLDRPGTAVFENFEIKPLN